MGDGGRGTEHGGTRKKAAQSPALSSAVPSGGADLMFRFRLGEPVYDVDHTVDIPDQTDRERDEVVPSRLQMHGPGEGDHRPRDRPGRGGPASVSGSAALDPTAAWVAHAHQVHSAADRAQCWRTPLHLLGSLRVMQGCHRVPSASAGSSVTASVLRHVRAGRWSIGRPALPRAPGGPWSARRGTLGSGRAPTASAGWEDQDDHPGGAIP
jgi:hypothetical protein